MIKICSFIINDRLYTIYDVERISGKNSYVGQTQYDTGEVYVEGATAEEMLLTLKHELMHIWLYENGHKNQDNNEMFSYEDLCEYVALSNNFINRITDKYIKYHSKQYA